MLELLNISCGYTDEDIVKNISFSAKSGEKICIIGPNGCGKTTLLRAINGLLDYKGIIKIENKDIRNLSRNEISKSIALMTQLPQVYFSFSVYDTVALGRYVHQEKKLLAGNSKNDREIIDNCIEMVGLSDLKDRQISELSGGQLQRVFLAKVFAQQPKIIMLDEPTNHLDLKHQLELTNLLNSWAENDGNIVIGVMHDLNLALQFADKFILLDKGKAVFSGNATELVKSDILENVYKTDIKSYMKNSFEIWS